MVGAGEGLVSMVGRRLSGGGAHFGGEGELE